MKTEYAVAAANDAQQLSVNVNDLVRRMMEDGLPAVLARLANEGMPQDVIDSALTENSIVFADRAVLSQDLARSLACGLLAAEQEAFQKGETALTYRSFAPEISFAYERR